MAENITLTNFPPSGTSGELRNLVFGPTGPIQVLLTVNVDDETDDIDIDLTLSNACEHDELTTFLPELIELLTAISDSRAVESALEKELEKDND